MNGLIGTYGPLQFHPLLDHQVSLYISFNLIMILIESIVKITVYIREEIRVIRPLGQRLMQNLSYVCML